jgi:hypothetical protein
MKAIEITTHYSPTVLGFSSIDFLLMTGVCWGFALVLAARSWMKLNEPKIQALRREQFAAEARRQAREMELSIQSSENGGLAPPDDTREVAGGERG